MESVIERQSAEELPSLPKILDETFLGDVIYGLSQPQKQLPCKYFYDEVGSALFDQICNLEKYYLTRTELEIMNDSVGEISELMGRSCALIEFGSGSSLKTRLLLKKIPQLTAYIPIDISHQHLIKTAKSLFKDFPSVPIVPLTADFTSDITLPEVIDQVEKWVVYFPGSTIGNFTESEAKILLSKIASLVQRGGGLLIGIDLVKNREILESAYNDKRGITARFNLNLLARMKCDLNAEVNLDQFKHVAFYNPTEERIEMHLSSLSDQVIKVGDKIFKFKTGETIHTEKSHKYRIEKFEKMALTAGLTRIKYWTDKKGLFSVQYFEVC